MTPHERKKLRMIRTHGRKVAAPYTSCNPYEYAHRRKEAGPLYGHCAAMAVAVQAACGGDIVTGRVIGIQHYWNRLPSGEEVDLTSCQFGGDGWKPLTKGRKVAPRKRIAPRFLLFMERVANSLRLSKVKR